MMRSNLYSICQTYSYIWHFLCSIIHLRLFTCFIAELWGLWDVLLWLWDGLLWFWKFYWIWTLPIWNRWYRGHQSLVCPWVLPFHLCFHLHASATVSHTSFFWFFAYCFFYYPKIIAVTAITQCTCIADIQLRQLNYGPASCEIRLQMWPWPTQRSPWRLNITQEWTFCYLAVANATIMA